MTTPEQFTFTAEEIERLERIERLSVEGAAGIAPLIDRLDDRSWTVRRAVVAALAGAGPEAVGPLCEALASRRDNEARIAAMVDALSAAGADPTATLIAMVDHPDPAVVADVAQILGRRRSAAGLPSIVALTRHRNDNVAVAAIEALGRIGGRIAVDSLVESIGSGNFFRTFPAIDVLGRSGDPRAVAPLTVLLGVPQYATEAARALGRTGDRAAVAPLLRLLERGGHANVRVAALALGDLRQRHAEHFGTDGPIEEAVRTGGTATIARHAARALPEADPAEQVALCLLLGTMGDTSTTPVLLAMLEGPPEVVEAASTALKRFGSAAEAQILDDIRRGGVRRALLPLVSHPTASALVVGCLGDAEPDVRAAACEALGRMGATSAAGALFPLLADPNPRVAFAAMGAIQSLGGRATESLTLAAARSPEPRVRRAAVRILAYFGYPSAVDTMIGALSDQDDRVREAAVQGMPFFDDPKAIEAVLGVAKSPLPKMRAAAMRALGQCVADLRVSAYLIKGLADPDPWARYYACQALGRLEFEPAVETIAQLLGDPAGQVRVAAVEALSFLKSESARKALERAARSQEPDVQRAALVGLGVAHRSESVSVLLEAARSPDSATRIVALSAMAGIKTPEVLQALAAGASDGEEQIRTVAIGLLAGVPGAAATATLARLLADSPAREQIVTALSVHVEGRVPGLSATLEEADDETANALTSALARLRRPEATSALIGAMTGPNSRARKAAATTLAGLGSKEAIDILKVAAANDPEPEVRKVCALLLTR